MQVPVVPAMDVTPLYHALAEGLPTPWTWRREFGECVRKRAKKPEWDTSFPAYEVDTLLRLGYVESRVVPNPDRPQVKARQYRRVAQLPELVVRDFNKELREAEEARYRREMAELQRERESGKYDNPLYKQLREQWMLLAREFLPDLLRELYGLEPKQEEGNDGH